MTRLLMIEDDEKLVSLTRDYLESHGFDVASAADGPAGVEAALSGGAELVVLDLMLPGLDGLEVCRRIRRASRVPILMLTARGDETDRIVGLEIGADDYLPKPFNPRELLARIRAILRRSAEDATAGATALRAGPIVIDTASRTVTVRGDAVELTTAEFDILRALAAGAGRVLSREQLLRRIHGTEWASYERTVDVHVSRIRAKLGDDPKRPRLLKTVRGVGYQLVKTEPS